MRSVSVTKWTCPNCGKVVKAKDIVLPIRCRCGLVATVCEPCETIVEERPDKKPITVCPFRGEEIRREECPGCKGGVQIKVYSCSQFSECQVAKTIEGVHVCDGGSFTSQST